MKKTAYCCRERLVPVLIAIAIVFTVQAVSAAQDAALDPTVYGQPADSARMRGQGIELEVMLQGKMTKMDGSKLENPSLQVTLYHHLDEHHYDAQVDGGRFSVWLPMNKFLWHNVILDAKDDRGFQSFTFNSRESIFQYLRQDIELELRPVSRPVKVRTSFGDKPIEGAHVRAELLNRRRVSAVTNSNGECTMELDSKDSISSLTAWKGNELYGGYHTFLKPVRDPLANEYAIELFACGERKIKATTPDGTPAVGVRLSPSADGPEPDGNPFGTPDDAEIQTDANGFALWKRFPTSYKARRGVAVSAGQPWRHEDILDGDEYDTVIVNPTQPRHRITGFASADGHNVAGLNVMAVTPTSESQYSYENLYCIADKDGRFEFDVLADSIYVFYVQDKRLVSNYVKEKAFDSILEQKTSPYLHVTPGIPLVIEATHGPLNLPYELKAGVSSLYEFQYMSQGRPARGGAGPGYSASADQNGRAVIYVPEGKTRIYSRTADWKNETEINVVKGADNRVTIHRGNLYPVNAAGSLLLKSSDTDLSGTKVFFASLDNEVVHEGFVDADESGNFSIETKAQKLELFALTKDKKYSGITTVEDTSRPFHIDLLPTTSCVGQLLDSDGQVVANQKIDIEATIGQINMDLNVVQEYSVFDNQTTTESNGVFKFDRIPTQLPLFISSATASGNSDGFKRLKSLTLNSGEDQKLITVNLPSPQSTAPRKAISLEERFARATLDSKVNGYRVMVILKNADDKKSTRFIGDYVLNLADTPENSHYIHIPITIEETQTKPDFAQSKSWNQLATDNVLVIIYDDRGTELTRKLFDILQPNASTEAKEFVVKNALPRGNAIKKWQQALEQAKTSNRCVWMSIGHRYCSPCSALSRWYETHRDILDQDYIYLKIDAMNDDECESMSAKIEGHETSGVPVHAIFSPDGSILITSIGPHGNIGYAGGEGGLEHFRKMLNAGRKKMTDQQIDLLVKSAAED